MSMNQMVRSRQHRAQLRISTPDARGWSDEELLTRALGGEERAWAELLRRFHRVIRGCIGRLIGRHRGILSTLDADEIYAEVLVALLANDKRRLRRFDPKRGAKLSSWLGVLTNRLTYDYLRAKAARPMSTRTEISPELESDRASPLDEVLEQERRARLTDALEAYSERDRTFIALYANGLEVDEIADQMQISVSTVYSRKHKIVARLQATFGAAA